MWGNCMIRVVVYHHLGMGDHFICNGLVNELSKKYDELVLVCKRNYSKTVRHLYADNSKVKVHEIISEPADVFSFCEKENLPLLRIGFENMNPKDFEKSFYAQLGLPFEYRNTRFELPSDLDTSKIFYEATVKALGDDYIFIHDESSVGKYDLKIESDLPRFYVKREDTDDVLDYVHTICNAKQVHFINSGLFPLVVALYYKRMLKAKEVFFHDCRTIAQGGLFINIPETFNRVNYS